MSLEKLNQIIKSNPPRKLKGRGKISEFGVSTTAGFDWEYRRQDMVWENIYTWRLLQLANASDLLKYFSAFVEAIDDPDTATQEPGGAWRWSMDDAPWNGDKIWLTDGKSVKLSGWRSDVHGQPGWYCFNQARPDFSYFRQIGNEPIAWQPYIVPSLPKIRRPAQ